MVRKTHDHHGRIGRDVVRWLAAVTLWAAVMLAPVSAGAAGDPWSEDVSWISVRAGSASSGARFAPDGGFGYGFSYTWFLSNQLAWTATAQHDLLGHYGRAAEMEVPLTVEFTRHFHIATTTRPFIGLGWGGIFHKVYRTGDDASGFRQGVHLTIGGNSMLGATSLIGVDARLMLEQDTRSINPTFPNIEPSTSNWGVKLTYSRVL
jgi:hypothetical protein